MSKKNEKRKKNLEREKKHAKEALIPIIAALFFLGLGVLGINNNRKYLREYNNSEDVRDVTALVTDAKLQSDDVSSRMWYVHLKYDVEGTEYRDATSLKTNEARVGETITVEVYKRPNGKYVIPEITDRFSLAVSNVMMYVSLVVGALLMAAGVFLLVISLRTIKELQAKIQPDSTAQIRDTEG